jgi:hypothetical protein
VRVALGWIRFGRRCLHLSPLGRGEVPQRAEILISMALEAHQRTHRQIHRPQFGRAAEVRQVDDEAGRDYIGADLAQ